MNNVLNAVGLSISERKLVCPDRQAVCLGILIDSKRGTLSIPEQKMAQIVQLVKLWSAKTHCFSDQLQSLLEPLLYLHKCIKPTTCFVNRMLELLRSNCNEQRIKITTDFQRDLRWFQNFAGLQ